MRDLLAAIAGLIVLSPLIPAAEGTGGSNAGIAPSPAPSLVSFAPMLKQVAPCVVSVYSTSQAKADPTESPLDELAPFMPFFGPAPFDFQAPPQAPRVQHGLGSGVIVSDDGYILTNSHVVADAQDIEVRLTDASDRIPAKVVGQDPQTDIAVLKVEAPGKRLPVIPFGDSARAQVGDLVFAVGNPFAVGQTVTMGIISATQRGGLSIEDYEDFIQTDAAINPGNSGGALVTSDGKLVGINTAILSPSGGNLGIGFAIPIGMARTVSDAIIAHGKVSRGYLGIGIQALTPELAKALKLPTDHGVLVSDVVADGPAAKAGLSAGDVITHVDGTEVQDPRRLRLLIGNLPPGTETKLDVLHEGKERTLSATLGDLANHASSAANGRPAGASTEGPVIGVQLADLDSSSRQELSIPKEVAGALIVGVQPGSPAAEAGMARGDVITSVDGSSVTSADAATAAIHQSRKGSLLLRVWRKGLNRFVAIDTSDRSGDGSGRGSAQDPQRSTK